MKLKPELGVASLAGWSAGADGYIKLKPLGAIVCCVSLVEEAAAGYIKPKAEAGIEAGYSSAC